MKLYTTASNAKRAATALATKHDNLDVAEKMLPGEDGEGFYATLHVNMGVVSREVLAEAKVIPDPKKVVDTTILKDGAPITEPAKPDVLPLTDKDGKVGAVLDLNPNAAKGELTVLKEIGKGNLDAAKPARDNKTTKALAMMSRKNGATTEELIKALDWQKHTVRGFVSTQNSKQKRGIVTIRDKGVTSYKIG
jgi:hypothetical protein